MLYKGNFFVVSLTLLYFVTGQSNDATFLNEISQAINAYKYEKCISFDCLKLRLGRDLSHFNLGFDKEAFYDSLKKFGGVHYQIIKHRLYRTPECYIPSRCEGVDEMLLEIINDLNDTEFILLADVPGIQGRKEKVPIFSHCKLRKNFDILFPEWSFYGGGPVIPKYFPDGVGDWKNYKEKLEKESNKLTWEQKFDRVYFRGSRKVKVRDIAINLTYHYPSLYDVKYVKNQAWRTQADSGGYDPVEYESPLQACKYKYLLDLGTDGCSARTRNSFLCKSLVFRPQNGFEEFWTYSLKPWIHYIPINFNNSDLEEKINFALNNQEISRKIAERGHEFVKTILEMNHVYGYWKLLLNEYTKFIKWPLEKHSNTQLRVSDRGSKINEL